MQSSTFFRVPIIFAALLLLLPAVCACHGGEAEANVTVSEMKSRLAKDGGIILDVRTEPELTGELGALKHVVNIPLSDLSNRIGELRKRGKGPIYVICRSGNRSRTATYVLRQQGLDAYNVEGGVRAWRKAYGSKDH